MTIENYIAESDYNSRKKEYEKIVKARNNAVAILQDAKARYIKKKTGARSKKAAMEKDTALNAPRFQKLADYDRREDIQEAYGFDYLTESERDKLEDLWDEREAIREKVTDGVYSDYVTQILDELELKALDFMAEEAAAFEAMDFKFQKQQKELEEESRAVNMTIFTHHAKPADDLIISLQKNLKEE